MKPGAVVYTLKARCHKCQKLLPIDQIKEEVERQQRTYQMVQPDQHFYHRHCRRTSSLVR